MWLIEQFRHPVGRRFWEFPQGAWEERDVSPEELARGELAEETGLRAASMELLGRLHFAYGLTDQAVDVWRATGLEPGPQALEETEEGLWSRGSPSEWSGWCVRTRSATPPRSRRGTSRRAEGAGERHAFEGPSRIDRQRRPNPPPYWQRVRRRSGGDGPPAHDHVAPQQARHLPGRGAVERLASSSSSRGPSPTTRHGTAREW